MPLPVLLCGWDLMHDQAEADNNSGHVCRTNCLLPRRVGTGGGGRPSTCCSLVGLAVASCVIRYASCHEREIGQKQVPTIPPPPRLPWGGVSVVPLLLHSTLELTEHDVHWQGRRITYGMLSALERLVSPKSLNKNGCLSCKADKPQEIHDNWGRTGRAKERIIGMGRRGFKTGRGNKTGIPKVQNLLRLPLKAVSCITQFCAPPPPPFKGVPFCATLRLGRNF